VEEEGVKAVIFDMDGLMIDSERVTYDGYVIEFAKLGFDYPKEFYKKLLGKRIPEILDLHYQMFGKDIDMETIISNVHAYMANQFETVGVPLKPGLKELLSYLKEHGCKTIVATSSQRARVDKILSLAGITEYFDGSICGDEVANGKPHPETFLKACEKLGVEPCEAVVLEDSESGILAGWNGKIRVICVPDMKYPEPEYADKCWKIVDSLHDVIDILEEEK
jgi:HAD superfamily hydrolase (TIGR01509 family)